MKVLLDTDTCVFALHHRAEVLAHLRRLSPDDVAVSAMTLAELRFGARKSQDPVARQRDVEAFLEPLRILPFEERAAEHHADLRLALAEKPIGERDLVIAATARSRRLTLVTHNTREFARCPELRVVDWVQSAK